ncbi:hypothetical protein [Neoroseomonas lacus]|uniref:Uncharacterized protein n=1 Tax=Neoroseomonas lacus TaxID=287609 RepID=A0A917KBH1_9PROT|nr:hypothetical protein [Neoroseomonas lacus]GGJ05705.1 hypothetical protein GCM10011320_10700 [Neoroseomonas lacus]
MLLLLVLVLAELAALALSALVYRLRPGFLPRWAAALLAPVLVMLAGFTFVGWSASRLPPDGFDLHLLVLSPPFAFAIFAPVGVALLGWVFFTRGHAP